MKNSDSDIICEFKKKRLSFLMEILFLLDKSEYVKDHEEKFMIGLHRGCILVIN